jgi:SH3-like domain-containing protein
MFLCRSIVLWLTPLIVLLAAPAHAQSMVSVDRPSVYLREGPGTRNEALWKLSRGYPLQVLASKSGWLKVRDFEGDGGWILGRLTAKKPHFVVKVPVANIRRAPSTKQRIVAKAVYGEVLRTLERRRDWVRVRKANGTSGWVSRRLLWGW